MEDFLGFPAGTAAALLGIAVLYFILSWAPLWWPMLVVLRRTPNLPRRWLFTLTIACLTYGAMFFMFFAFTFPALGYSIFVAPQLQAVGAPYGKWFVTGVRYISDYWWFALPPVLFTATVIITRRLLAVWPRLWGNA